MIQILRAPAPGRNPPLCRLEYLEGAPLLEATDDVSRRRNAAWAAGGEVRSDFRDAEETATGLLVGRLEHLKRELTVSLVGASDFRRFQLNALLADVDRLLEAARRELLEIARQAYNQGAVLGTAHADQPIEAAGLKVTLPSGLDSVLVTHAFDNTADLLTETMQQFRARVTTNVRRIAVAGDGFASGMLELSRDIGMAGLDNAAYRAERIIRTELGRTFNGATFERLLELASRVSALRKIWIRTRDERTRDTHADAGVRYARGRGIAIAELFSVGSVRMRFPIDPQATPPGKRAARETIMCRCNAATDFDPIALAADTTARVRLALGGPVLPPRPEPEPAPVPVPASKPRAPRAPKAFDPAKLRAKMLAALDKTNAEALSQRATWEDLEGRLYTARSNQLAAVPGSKDAELWTAVRERLSADYDVAFNKWRALRDETLKIARKAVAVPKAYRPDYRLEFMTDRPEWGVKPADRKRYAEALKAFQSLVGTKSTGANFGGYRNGDMLVSLNEDKNQRASMANGKWLGTRHVMNAVRYTSERTIVHELGHTLEFDDQRILDAAIAFRNKRTAGNPLRKLSDITGDKAYKDEEVAKDDKFRSVYAGKVYTHKGLPGEYATEIVSLGVEWLYAEPEQFAREDPEYFDFMLKLLRGIF